MTNPYLLNESTNSDKKKFAISIYISSRVSCISLNELDAIQFAAPQKGTPANDSKLVIEMMKMVKIRMASNSFKEMQETRDDSIC